MYTRTYPRGGEPQTVPVNYGGTALSGENSANGHRFEDMEAPVCREMDISSDSEPVEEAQKADAEAERGEASGPLKLPLFESFATGDLLLLAVAALLSQSEQPDNELLIILLLLLLGN